MLTTRRSLTLLGLAVASLATAWLAPQKASADDPPRVVEFAFTPTERAQVALWIEAEDGSLFRTVVLTQSVARRGIGNRPGATLMNSGFRWPYGRREGVLPVWAHRRVESGGSQFERVIFQDRGSEGFASRTSNDASRDDYFCLSFDASRSSRDALDAVSCASVFSSDKGRYLTASDVDNGYSEPYERDGEAFMRPLQVGSLYPPRLDVERCTAAGCSDHEDVENYARDARAAMPELDAVTTATYLGGSRKLIQFTVPEEWPDGDYVAWLEINVEGDYNDHYNDTAYPTPRTPDGRWDFWAMTYGYPYRGQPSVAFRVPFSINATGGEFQTADAEGFGALEGDAPMVEAIDNTISDDHEDAPGSGADRLHLTGDSRFTVRVQPRNVCESEDPPPECGAECTSDDACGDGFLCNDDECVGMCDLDLPPSGVSDFNVESHSDEKQAHHFAVLSFEVPETPRAIARYEVRVSNEPIVDDESFDRAAPANAATLDSVELILPTEAEPGEVVTLDFGGLTPETTFYVAMRTFDICNSSSEIVTAEVTTAAIHFETVSPCFVATATYGSPMASEIKTLRRFRDRYMRNNALGQAAVDVYHSVGPHAADVIREDDTLRGVARAVLSPIVDLAGALTSE